MVRRKHSVVSHELRSGDHIRFMVQNMQQIKAGLQMHIIEKPTIMRSCVFFFKTIAGEY
jgi:predicted secreted Zn-dependent protease